MLVPKFRKFLFIGLLLACGSALHAYSVLTHEEIVDIAWNDQIKPLLLKRFPNLTEDDLRQAHAYAYGGAVIQDLGYYPFGSKEFSDMVHYVRSGDFVEALLHESQDANEYAFALGALAHYVSDTEGHPAVNRAVGLEFPKLRRKFGPSVTYNDNPLAHIRTEFGFDVAQVAKERYTGDQYHAFIGFEVAQSLLERTFPKVYGIPFSDVIPHEELAIGTYRWSVSSLVPKMTKVAKLVKGDEVTSEKNDHARKLFLYHISRADYEKDWGTKYRRAGFGTRVLAFFLRLVPKVGPFKALAFHPPTIQTQDLYFKSINATVDRYRTELHAVNVGHLELANLDFDTGKPAAPGEYALTDKTYATWLNRLAKDNFAGLTPMARVNILEFYSDPKAPIATRKNKDDWKKTETELQQLKSWRPTKAESASAELTQSK